MVHMESPPQGFYAPLSQATTDSDYSEEEIHNSAKQRHIIRRQQEQKDYEFANSRLRSRNPEQASDQNTALQPERDLGEEAQQYFHRKQHFQLSTQPLETEDHINTYNTNMQSTFRSVVMSDIGGGLSSDATQCDPGSNFSSFNSDYDERNHIDADDVAILGRSGSGSGSCSLKHNEPMSTGRRCCFIASLLLCVFTVLGFVWLVPCSEESTCPALVDRVKTHNWLKNYTKIELKGDVNVVSGLRNWENNLIFLYRGDTLFPEFKNSNTKRNGIISLIGSSGAVAWYDEMADEPVAIDCTLIDVDRNGRPDCLVIDEYGELGAINPISGQWYWKFKERSVHKVDALDFPAILPDLDGDSVLEILMVTSANLEQRTKNYMRHGEVPVHDTGKSKRNFLRILSGRSGKPIGEGFKIHDCDVLRKLQLLETDRQTVTYNCVRNNTEAQRVKTLAELFALITNKSILGQKLMPVSKISQHRHYGQRKDTDAQRNIYSLSGRELVVENRGTCPEDCNVTLILSEALNGKTKVIRNFTSSGMYGMVPAQWHFRNTKTKMSGFVMKFWKWDNVSSNANKQNMSRESGDNYNNNNFTTRKKSKSNNSKNNLTRSSKHNQTESQSNRVRKSRSKREQWMHELPMSEFNTFDQFVQKRSTFSISMDEVLRVRRNIVNMTKPKAEGNFFVNNYKMHIITETVILVLFINNNTRIENTSQSSIVQFCRHNLNEIVCQPDLNNQENSMLIADLDQDGSQELVSYMSTFVQSDEEFEMWKLVTYVRLLRLQSELPALYDNDEQHD